MKRLMTLIALGVLVAQTYHVEAASSRGRKGKASAAKSVTKRGANQRVKAQAKAAGDLKTDVSFDDSVLHGEYQTPDEALARVENEKGLGDLLGVRKHFKDRLGQSVEQE